MAAASATLTVPSRHLDFLFGAMEMNYWSSLTEIERDMCFGDLSHLVYQGQQMWNIAGCIEDLWKHSLSLKIAEISNNPQNLTKIHGRRSRRRAIMVVDMFIYGFTERRADAVPAVFVLCADSTTAKRAVSVLSCHETVKIPGFVVLHHESKTELRGQHDARQIQKQSIPCEIDNSSEITILEKPMAQEPVRENKSLEIEADPKSSEVQAAAELYEDWESIHDGYSSYNSSRSASAHSNSTSGSSRPRSIYSISTPGSQRSRSTHSNGTLDSSKRRHRGNRTLQQPSHTVSPKVLCGSRIVITAMPAGDLSNWEQCTIGGVI
jgi:hypothetical protein